MYINLIGTFPLSNVARVQRASTECSIEHRIIDECGCIDRGNATELARMDSNTVILNTELANLSKTWSANLRADGRDDVAVVYHDFMAAGDIGGELVRDDLSELDCFHPSARAHQALAAGLWDSIVCPGDRADGLICGKKPTITSAVPECPSAFTTLWVPN
mmetsp:Transcript_22733/g.68479  ORF Transcript_22733/g.68479 Transcript_22733/m.68479 type:complete len:161 (+) Transcript_22733:642-1124(+)